MVATPKPLIAIVGPTASGKSDLAMRVARQFAGEIICADSRTVYKGADIGTAKPKPDELQTVPHHGLDLVVPGQKFSVADFKKYAEPKIEEIKARNCLPILVGGTGLYVDSVLLDYQFRQPANTKNRSLLEVKTVQELQQIILKSNLELPVNKQNKRHLIRVIETGGQVSKKDKLRADAIVFGLLPSNSLLKQQISKRAVKMFESGVVEETKELFNQYGPKKTAELGIIYKALLQYLSGEISLKQAQAVFITADWQYARRQKTWFRRHHFIQWSSGADEAYKKIVHFLTTDNI